MNATRSAIAATVFLAAAMTASVYLITDFLFREPATAAVTASLAALFTWLVRPPADAPIPGRKRGS